MLKIFLHGSQNEVITRLVEELSFLELAKMVEHRNLWWLQAYYNNAAEQIAGWLDWEM